MKDPMRGRLEFRRTSAERPGDLNADGRIDIEDLAVIHATLSDLDGVNGASSSDKDLLQRYLRRLEREDVAANRE